MNALIYMHIEGKVTGKRPLANLDERGCVIIGLHLGQNSDLRTNKIQAH